MRKIILIHLIGIFILGCGQTGNTENDTYDLWHYMTPTADYEMEYDIYENGSRVDYIIETIKILQTGVVQRQNSQGDIVTLRLGIGTVSIEQAALETIIFQRYVKVDETDIVQSPDTHVCDVTAYYRSISIKEREFYNVLQIDCQKNDQNSTYYYGYDEGIVAVNSTEEGIYKELVKVDERRL